MNDIWPNLKILMWLEHKDYIKTAFKTDFSFYEP